MALLAGFDAILCCETLEHLHWPDADAILAKFRQAEPRFLVISVPYQGFQIDWRLYLNAHTLRHAFAFKKLKSLRRFQADEAADPYGHKWEVGYKGYSLKALERLIAEAGWRVARREFTTPTRSVFYLLEPA